MAYQSLYRRYRPARFEQVRGQEHIVLALRNAVRDGRVSHAYMFSGPRGTGKTTTARILARALNCTDLSPEGEPCGACDACIGIGNGSSLDLHELDAASHNGVDDMRDLVASAALGTPGRTKVYILDEVHMLSKAASNALLKTLEEPPSHVVFVLATTDPQKVLPTIRSRTQQHEFRLLPAETLAEHVRWVADDAGFELDDEAVEYVLRAGGGSARDTLSAVDQVVAAGGSASDADETPAIVEALCEHDTGAVLIAVAKAVEAGRDPRQLAESLLEHLRNVFLSTMAPDVVRLPDRARAEAAQQAGRLGPAATVRALEVIGEALAEMRLAPDARIPLEVGLVRLTRPEIDTSVAGLVERIERLERRPAGAPVGGTEPSTVQAGRGPTAATDTAPATPAPPPTPPKSRASAAVEAPAAPAAVAPTRPSPPPSGEAAARSTAPPRPTADQPNAATAPPAPAGAEGAAPTPEQLAVAWNDAILGALPGRARSVFRAGRFLAVTNGLVTFAVPDKFHAERCQEVERKAAVEQALSNHFGTTLRVEIVVDGGGTPAPQPQPAVSTGGPAAPPTTADPAAAASTTATPAAVPRDDPVAGSPPADQPSSGAVPEPSTPAVSSAPVSTTPVSSSEDEMDEIGDVSRLDDADVELPSTVDLLKETFSGGEIVEDPNQMRN